MRYKKGDRVRVRSLEWYNANKNSEGAIISHDWHIFDESMSEFCGKVVTIVYYNSRGDCYEIEEDGKVNYWSVDMFEGLAIEKPQEKMVSLEQACEWLKNTIDDDVLVKCGSVIKCMDANEFSEYFKNAMK